MNQPLGSQHSRINRKRKSPRVEYKSEVIVNCFNCQDSVSYPGRQRKTGQTVPVLTPNKKRKRKKKTKAKTKGAASKKRSITKLETFLEKL